MTEIRVGTCGWSVRGGRRAYFTKFNAIELQDTFYNLPTLDTARRLREEAPNNFHYCMKAWQVITHPHTSPTWRKLRVKIPSDKAKNYGLLRPTRENFEAWESVLEFARELGAKFIVLQTPPSFGYSEEAVKWVKEFFASAVPASGPVIGWEPRGTWNQHLEKVREICDSYGVVHVVDPFRRDPVSKHKVTYLRLHGIGPGEVNYRYKYTDEDLVKLRNKIEHYSKVLSKDIIYVFFNNVHMANDAERFLKLVRGTQ
ncbi:MAG: DUF72 domain-containing protein [Thermoprotei archaeon]|nr:MAG: DUF72 domain-containing protein [Thermoprotei archaeon]